MVPPIPVEDRREIVRLRVDGHSFKDIREILMKRGLKYSVIGIGNCYQKIIKSGSVEAQPKQKYTKEMLERIKAELQVILEGNSDLTGQQQIDELKRRLGVTVSMDAVGRYRRMLGWKVMPTTSTKESQSLDKPERRNESILTGNNGDSNSSSSGSSTVSNTSSSSISLLPDQHHFGDLITHSPLHFGPGIDIPDAVKLGHFYHNTEMLHQYGSMNGNLGVLDTKAEEGVELESEEHSRFGHGYSSFITAGIMGCSARFGPSHVFTSYSFIKYGKEGRLRYQVWAGISFQGATSICIWDGNSRIKAGFYCSTILTKFFLPFRQERYPHKKCILVQNSGSIFRANETKEFFQANGLESEIWCPSECEGESNPMDLIWAEINQHIKIEIRPKTLDDLRDAICTFWATKMTDSKCRQLLQKCSIFSEHTG